MVDNSIVLLNKKKKKKLMFNLIMEYYEYTIEFKQFYRSKTNSGNKSFKYLNNRKISKYKYEKVIKKYFKY